MKLFWLVSHVSGLASAAATGYCDQFNPSCYSSSNVIRRDVAVIGGGATGSYGAIKLKDAGKTVVVIEKQAQFGGRVETYTVPNNGTKVDYGVIAYSNVTEVTSFFARFNVPLTKGSAPMGTNVYADFTSGQALANFKPSTDFSAYATQANKYPYLDTTWNLPNPVPADLLLSFSDFITKYSLQNVAYSVWSSNGAGGYGQILSKSMANVFKAVGHAFLQEQQTGALLTLRHNNQELYDKVQAELGANALVSSTVTAAQRPSNNTGVKLVVKTPQGNKLIIASQLLVATNTLLPSVLSPLSLDSRENNLFSKFTTSSYYTGLVNTTGLPMGTSYYNAGASTQYNIPSFPGMYHLLPTAYPGIYSFWYGSDAPVASSKVQSDVLAAVQKLGGVAPTMLAFDDHSPYDPIAPTNAIQNGFYRDLNNLQGYRSTWYTGSTFAPATGPLWQFTQTLVPRIASAA